MDIEKLEGKGGHRYSVDPATGFLTPSGNWSNAGFTAGRKTEFISLIYENPHFGLICRKIGINYSTFARHMNLDPEFNRQVVHWSREARMYHKGQLEETMLTNGKKPNGYMDRITWLRRYFPEEYNPKTILQHQEADISRLIEEDFQKLLDYDREEREEGKLLNVEILKNPKPAFKIP